MARFGAWIDGVFGELSRQFRWSFLPPLMVYFAAGISAMTGIVGTFYVKEYLALSASFLAGLAFWAGLPWALKMPLGHLVDLIWRWKALLVWLGAALIAASVLIMVGLVVQRAAMEAIMRAESWYVLSVLLAPLGYVIQDTVADAMSVEAVPQTDEAGRTLAESEIKAMHTTMQTLGRIALIGGTVFVALLNIAMFAGVEALSQEAKGAIYARIYLWALAIPLVSVSGVTLAWLLQRRRVARMRAQGLGEAQIDALFAPAGKTEPNPWIFGGGAAFVALTLAIGLGDAPFAQEIVFAGSLAIVLTLMRQLIGAMTPEKARMLVGTAVIVFVFRATPLPGDGATWFNIDRLGFDQQFLSVLSLIAAGLTLVGMVLLRPLIARRSIATIMVLLTLAGFALSLPNIGLYYGVHEWTQAWTGGVVDARFIAVVNTALESPLGQVAMIPMLAWIAKNAPDNLKATFFAVMASFTNLALSASALLTKYLNELFVVTREVRNAAGAIQTPADYSQLGWLLIVVTLIGLAAPLVTVLVVQRTRLRTQE